MTCMAKFDNGLMAALRSGVGELPNDLGALADCLETIAVLLAEKANELEPSWGEALAAAAEVETLLELEAAVAERVIGVRAASLAEVRRKIAIWQTLADGCDEACADPFRDRLIDSIDADLARLG